MIDIKEGVLKINGQQVEMPSNIEIWNQVIGAKARVLDSARVAYAWDDYGIKALTDKNGKIYYFKIYFRELPGYTPSGAKERLPKKLFTGTLILEGIKLDETLSYYDYNKMTTNDKHRFYESYVYTYYRRAGVRLLSNSDYVFGATSRIDKEKYPYMIELGYSYVPLPKQDPNKKKAPNKTKKLIKSLKKDGDDLLDRALKVLDLECEDECDK